MNIWSNPFDNAIAIAYSSAFDSMPSAIKDIFIAISGFGDKGVFFIIVGILLLFFAKTRKIGLTCLIAAFLTLIFNDLIFKNIFDRARPFQDPNLVTQLQAVVNNSGLPYGIIPDSTSFPSGHSFTAFAAIGGLASLLVFDKDERKSYIAPLILFSIVGIIIASSRILLSHHYFTDVLAGCSLGLLFGFTTYFIIKYGDKLLKFIKTKLQK